MDIPSVFWQRGYLWLLVVVSLAVVSESAELKYSNQPCRTQFDTTNNPFSHALWDTMLKKYVDTQGLVNYKLWKLQDIPSLETYLNSLACVYPDQWTNRNEKMAYYINAYNAATLRGVMDFYPTKSIKAHAGVIGFNIWRDYKTYLGKAPNSLDEIEHNILRPMGDPRIHFAINCASIGCPVLRSEAYNSDKLNQQLEEQAMIFFQDPRHFRVDHAKNVVYFSSIFNWFGKDFGGTSAAKIAYAQRYVKDPGTLTFLRKKGLRIRYLDYDWGLNEQK